MYCRNCGNSMREEDKFCRKCGTAAEVPEVEEAVQAEAQAEVEGAKESDLGVEESQVADRVAYGENYNPRANIREPRIMGVEETKEKFDKLVKSFKGMAVAHQVIVGALVVILVMVFVRGISGGYGINQSTPEKAARSYFTSIANRDAKGFQQLIPPDGWKQIKAMGYNDASFNAEVREYINGAAERMEINLGKNWHKQLKYKDEGQSYTGAYIVGIYAGDDYIRVGMKKVGNKYYVDFDNFLWPAH